MIFILNFFFLVFQAISKIGLFFLRLLSIFSSKKAEVKFEPIYHGLDVIRLFFLRGKVELILWEETNYEKAERILSKSIPELRQMQQNVDQNFQNEVESLLADSLLSMGKTKLRLEKLDQAEHFASEAFEYTQQKITLETTAQDQKRLSEIYILLGKIKAQQDLLEETEKNFTKALEISKQLAVENPSENTKSLIKTHIKLAQSLQEIYAIDDENARDHYLESINLIHKNYQPGELSDFSTEVIQIRKGLDKFWNIEPESYLKNTQNMEKDFVDEFMKIS